MNILIRNARLWDGTGADTFDADVYVVGNRIENVWPSTSAPWVDEARIIDATGLTLMPGLVEGHAHLSFVGAPRSTDLGELPPEEHVLATMHNARTLLDHGFTSAFSAASAKLRLDVVIRNEIEAGRIPGPRLRAASPEITVTGGPGPVHTTDASALPARTLRARREPEPGWTPGEDSQHLSLIHI